MRDRLRRAVGTMSRRLARARFWRALYGAVLSSSCASIEPGRFGLRDLDLQGNTAVSAASIEACLISRGRERWSVSIGASEPVCGVPPFDASPIRLRLWRWPWTEWPTFNRAIFEQDLERVLRFYRARGYYDAKVAELRYVPSAAGGRGGARCDGSSGDCALDIEVVIEEGEASRVETVELQGINTLPAPVRAAVESAVAVSVGAPIDEALHDQSKAAMTTALRAAGFAAATVEGRVAVDTRARSAQVVYRVAPGPLYRFGSLTVSGHGALPAAVIERAAGLDDGAVFDPARLSEIQGEVFALGAFSAVDVEERLDAVRARADVTVRVTPLPKDALRIGIGVLSGATERTDTGEVQSIPQWDVHLLARYQRNHLFGSLGRITLEDRPRLVLDAAFPGLGELRPGNIATVRLDRPGIFEPRTSGFARASWDYGPDPYLGYFRSDVALRLGLSRGFLARRLLATLALEQDIFSVAGEVVTSEGLASSSYRYFYLEEELRLDLRDSRARPRSGAFFSLLASQAPRWAGSDWSALRVAPEARGYLPLPLDMVLGARLAVASLFVFDASSRLDDASERLGPTTYRLRGGGANSNRGFLAGRLGAGLAGGVRRWESSLELRVPLGQHWELAGFADAGDVYDVAAYELSHLNASLGYGVRYHTIIGAIRLDVGHRLTRLQRRITAADGSGVPASDAGTLPFSDAPGAVHLTIGDPF